MKKLVKLVVTSAELSTAIAAAINAALEAGMSVNAIGEVLNHVQTLLGEADDE